MTTELAIIYTPLDAIVPAVRNPKGHDGPGIRASMLRHGFVEPLIHDARTGRLVGGHGRLEELAAMRADGFAPPRGIRLEDDAWTVPVTFGYSSPDDAEAEALLVGLNRLPEAGGIAHPDMLADMLSTLAGTELGLSGSGFTDEELADLVASLTVPDFAPDTGGQPRLDQRNPVVCPNCQHEFHPR